MNFAPGQSHLERTKTHLARTPDIDDRRDADGVVDPELVELMCLEVDVRGVVLVRDRPGNACAGHVCSICGRGQVLRQTLLSTRYGLDT